VLIALHVVLLLTHDYIHFGLGDVLIPFTSPWRPLATAMGTVSMYLVAVLLLTSAIRSRIGYTTWRMLHMAAFPAWALATIHGIFAGSDSAAAAIQYMYLGAFAAVVLLLVFGAVRERRPTSKPERGPGA
jgi:DMSO/TMAO reductase YedYZ heme-binding membrane subunit